MFAAKVELLGVESEVIGITKGLFEDKSGLFEVVTARKALDVPKEHIENVPLLPTKCRPAFALVPQVTIHKRVFNGFQLALSKSISSVDRLD